MSEKPEHDRQLKVFDVCPHCGKELSPWEKVLLSVDRALTCKRCWYRIFLDVSRSDQPKSTGGATKSKDNQS